MPTNKSQTVQGDEPIKRDVSDAVILKKPIEEISFPPNTDKQ